MQGRGKDQADATTHAGETVRKLTPILDCDNLPHSHTASPWRTIRNESQLHAMSALATNLRHESQHNPQHGRPIGESAGSDPVAGPFAPTLLLHYPYANFLDPRFRDPWRLCGSIWRCIPVISFAGGVFLEGVRERSRAVWRCFPVVGVQRGIVCCSPLRSGNRCAQLP
jgi:hypothetical protein